MEFPTTRLSGRPLVSDYRTTVFHRLADSIRAHLTVVFAALADSGEAQTRSGLSINKVLKDLRRLRSATVTIATQQVTAQPRIPAEARALLNDLGWSAH
jgi:hypothetical protein